MSAFAGTEITDAEVEVSAGEMPALDGSAAKYAVALQSVGFTELGSVDFSQPFSRVFFQDANIEIAISKGTGHWRYSYEAANRWPGEQTFEREDIVSGYAEEVAPARTFALAEEVPMVLAAGLGKGLDIEQVLIVGLEGYKNDARFEDEPARHKMLDLLGDLYLAGVPARMLNVTAARSGHRTNVEAAARLLAATAGP